MPNSVLERRLEPFRRVTRGGKYLAEIDGLRFLAIASVVSLHCYAAVLDRLGWGVSAMEQGAGFLRLLGHGYGVEVFYAISGFIVLLPFARQHRKQGKRVRPGAYFLRRVLRLEPPYILWLVIRTGLLLLATPLTLSYLLVHLAASMFYLHSLLFSISSRIEAVSWTLEVEAQFYCLAPWLASLYRIPNAWFRRAVLAMLIAGATPLQAAFLPGWHGPQNVGAWNLSIFAAIQFFLAGMLIADLYVDDWERIPASWLWDGCSLVLWPLLFWLRPHPFRFLGPLLLPVLMVAALKGRAVPAILRHPVLSVIGGMCYSIYLTHRTSILLAGYLLRRVHLGFGGLLAAYLGLGSVLSLLAGAAYFRLVEKPCMALAASSR